LAPFKKFCYDKDVTGLILHHVNSGGNRVAENAQLAACVGMSMLYSSEPTEIGRIVRLDSSGRGNFANRTWLFESSGPLSYWPARAPDPFSWKAEIANEIDIKPPKYLLDDLVYKHLEDSELPRCPADIAGALQRNPNSIRNSIARLMALDRIRHTYTLSGSRFYDIHRDVPHVPTSFFGSQGNNGAFLETTEEEPD
jgi:hypothetical protein